MAGRPSPPENRINNIRSKPVFACLLHVRTKILPLRPHYYIGQSIEPQEPIRVNLGQNQKWQRNCQKFRTKWGEYCLNLDHTWNPPENPKTMSNDDREALLGQFEESGVELLMPIIFDSSSEEEGDDDKPQKPQAKVI